MRRLIGARAGDPKLSRVAAVVLDEFHERHLHGDVALAYLRKLQQEERPDLKLVVMSATLDTDALSRYLGGCAMMKVPGRTFDVTVEYRKDPVVRLESAVRDAVAAELAKSEFVLRPARIGDLLVFLPGMAEIRRCADSVSEVAREYDADVLPLHGDLSREEQDRAVDPAHPRRKIILSTNLAETSLTLPGITCVVDSGLARVASYSNWTGLSKLQTRSISRASAIQRAGRAGRTAPGRCFRLYPKYDFDGRAIFDVPEIQRADLAQTVLELKRLGIEDLLRFPWFETPGESALQAAQSLLFRLGALAADGRLTDLGGLLADWPAHPRLVKLAIESATKGVRAEGVRLAAALGEIRLSDFGGDWISKILRARDFELPPAVRKQEDRFEQSLKTGKGASRAPAAPKDEAARDIAIRRALLCAFPDRVAKKRNGSKPGTVELVMSGGGSAQVENSAEVAHSEYFLALDAEEKQGVAGPAGAKRSEVRVRSVCPVQPEWLFDLEPQQVSETEELSWDAERGRIESRYQMRFDALVLEESASTPKDLDRVAQIFAKNLLESRNASWFQKIADTEALMNQKNRFRFLRTQADQVGMPGMAALPDLDSADIIAQELARFLHGRFSVNEIVSQEDDFVQFLQTSVDPSLVAGIEKHAPLQITLKNGRRCKVHYEPDQPPWIESRLQDFFGMSQGPSIAGGKIPLTLHLLAPNYRAVQVTRDLAGFWARIYPELRRELGRRYPRHSWPEDPFQVG